MPRLFLRIVALYWAAVLTTIIVCALMLPRPGETNVDFVWALGSRILVAFVISVALSLMATHYMIRPIVGLRGAARALAAGDLTARAPLRKTGDRRDETNGLIADFNDMAARLETLVLSQEQLVRDVSHELRAPLARLRLAVDLLRQTHHDTESLALHIERDVDRLNSIISRFLFILRLESSAQVVTDEWFDLDDLLAQVLEESALEAAHKRCNLLREGVAPCPIRGDFELLRSAVENVVRNAIQHTEFGTPVIVRLQRIPGRRVVKVTIEDNGPGIAEADLNHLFQAFYRSDQRSSTGFGLGLAIARRAIALNQGTICIQNRMDVPGAHVDIELPLEADAP